ncbi:MAG: hypothetical protein JXC32_20555 [Anaerolineae bacterium]|nr:hypothetical protein [Anaerolineae bacterium]
MTSERYRNFDVAIYTRAYEVREMADLELLAARFDVMQRHLKVSKVYLETHRDTVMPDRATIEGAKRFFADRGVDTSGGITYTLNERNRFQTYCYTRPESRAKVQEIAEFTASLFDDFILDDFFFTNCKCPACIEAKGDRSWTDYRLQLMAEAAQELVVGPAKAVNPDVRVTIKYPNWYEHFPALGFNLELQPPIFDGLYTGTETRDAVVSMQHLQPYESYELVRYFESLKPGANLGGWVDPGGATTIDRYAEQLWLTVFAKAPECTLFDYRSLIRGLMPEQRAPWQGDRPAAPRSWGVGVDFDAMIDGRGYRKADGTLVEDATYSLAAGHAFELVDDIVGELGQPVGVASYRPYHATSDEDFLHNYLGMLGIPIALQATFPAEANTVLLTQAAAADPDIVGKIRQHLLDGKRVVVTSGLYKALQGGDPGNTIEDIVEMKVTDAKAIVSEYLMGWRTRVPGNGSILIPHIRYMTNDSWEEISGLTETTGHPLLHSAAYASGVLYVLTVPDNLDDLYKLPEPVLARIRQTVVADLPVRVDAPPQVAMFAYDNNTLIVESFLPEVVDISLVAAEGVTVVRDLLTGEEPAGEPVLDWFQRPTGVTRMATQVGPHMFRVFRFEKA